MLRYAITSRALYPGDELQRQAALLREASRWVADGIDIIQLREKDLPAANIAALAREILLAIAATTSPTRLLINSRPDIAIATGAHGVHLTSDQDELTPTQIRNLHASANRPTPIISISCHTLEEVRRARVNQADVDRLQIGQTAQITLDSYPSRTFRGRLDQLSRVGTTSTMSNRVRTFLATFSIEGADPHLMPDLAAAIDLVW